MYKKLKFIVFQYIFLTFVHIMKTRTLYVTIAMRIVSDTGRSSL